MRCPVCDSKLERMITDHPHIAHDLVEGWQCPECGYDSVYDDEEPVEDDEDDDDQQGHLKEMKLSRWVDNQNIIFYIKTCR